MKQIIYKFDINNMKKIALYSLIFMVIAHGFCYTNVLFSHDSIRAFFWTRTDTIDIGRYLIPVFLILRGKYYPPFLIGILTYCSIVLINYLIVDMFEIKSKVGSILTAGIISTASTLTLLNATYIDFSDIYVFALLLVTISAYLWRNYKYGYLIAIIPLFLSLPIYQPYISFYTGIVILLIIKDLINNKDIKELFLGSNGIIKAVISFCASMMFYYISLKIVTYFTGYQLSSDYNSVSGVMKFTGIRQFIDLFIGTYKQFFNFIFHPSTYYSVLVTIFNIILIITVLIICIKKSINNKNNLLLFAILLLVLPFTINFVYLLGKGVEHRLMTYSLFLLYIFAITIIENSSKYIKIFTTVIIAIMLFSNVVYSNQCYLKKKMDVDLTLTTVNRIIDRIEQVPNYEVGTTKVTFIGSLNNDDLHIIRKGFNYNDVGLGDNFGLTYYRTYNWFLNNYLAYPINVIPEEEMLKIKDKQEIIDMNVFPYQDSIKFVDDILVVKLSND